MCSEPTIRAAGLGKAYLIYARPEDRLKQMFWRGRKKLYREYWAFQNVSFDIARGEAVGIIGRNGSGKSTLLQVIAGTLQPNAGTLSVEGRIAPLLELGAGFNPEFTGRENVMLAATVLGLSNDEIRARFDDILDFAAIGDFIDQPVKAYSSGMYARLAFAVAAHVDADLLIVDEILSVGDAAFGQKCMRYIRKFKERGTLLFVSHDTAAVNALCDRAIWMDRGQVRADGPARDVGFEYQAALRNELDGGGFSIAGRARQATAAAPVRHDIRHASIRESDKRNVLDVFHFTPDGASFGLGGGRILYVAVTGGAGRDGIVEGGEDAVVTVRAEALDHLPLPILGFYVKDRLGQNLFGENTYLPYADTPVPVGPGDRLTARFAFRMPYLPSGEYVICVALANGTATDHVQHHWIDDALVIRVERSPLQVGAGMIGIPMHAIDLVRQDGEDGPER